jgi:GNAT superfamily N-acetyltransferase
MTTRIVETVVTYLLMSAPPREVPPKPVGPPLALMRADDIPLHYYRYLYRSVGVSWLWFERLLLDDQALAEKVHRKGVEIYVLYGNGAPAGFYELDFRDAERAALLYFGLMPEWLGRKIGPWLLGTAVLEGFSRGARELKVNTCTLDHPAALPLYQRIGFRPVARENRRITVPAHLELPRHIRAGAPA